MLDLIRRTLQWMRLLFARVRVGGVASGIAPTSAFTSPPCGTPCVPNSPPTTSRPHFSSDAVSPSCSPPIWGSTSTRI